MVFFLSTTFCTCPARLVLSPFLSTLNAFSMETPTSSTNTFFANSNQQQKIKKNYVYRKGL